MLRQPYWVCQPFHGLETGMSAGMGTASEGTLGPYGEGDPDGALRVTGLSGQLDLPKALGADHDGKATPSGAHPSPDHPRPPRRTERHSRSRKTAPPLPRTSASACSVRTG